MHTDIFNPYFSKQSVKNKIRVRFAKFLLPRADGIRVVSERIKPGLRAYGIRPTAISVLPIFINADHTRSLEKVKEAVEAGLTPLFLTMPKFLWKKMEIQKKPQLLFLHIMKRQESAMS